MIRSSIQVGRRRIGIKFCQRAFSLKQPNESVVAVPDDLLEEPRMRIDRLLSRAGMCARSDVSRFLRENTIEMVSVDDDQIARSNISASRILRISHKISARDLLINSERVWPTIGRPLHVVLHKPAGVVCEASDEVILEGAGLKEFPERWHHVQPSLKCAGRLDKIATGLLILSQSGALLHRITNPVHHVVKRYSVVLKHEFSASMRAETISQFASGRLTLKDAPEKPLLPARLEFDDLNPRKATVWLNEGKYHQLRRMFAAVGNRVEEIHREAIGSIELGDLPVGEWRLLEDAEVLQLWKAGEESTDDNPQALIMHGRQKHSKISTMHT